VTGKCAADITPLYLNITPLYSDRIRDSGGARRCKVSHFVSGPLRRPLVQLPFPDAPPVIPPVAEVAPSLKAIPRPRSGGLKEGVAFVPTVIVSALLLPNSVGGLFPAAPLLGFAAGLLVGISGIGMGSLLAPLLVLLLGVSPLVTVATNLVHSFLVRSVGAIQHYQQRTVDTALLKPLAVGALPASMLGATLTSFAVVGRVGFVDALMKAAIGVSPDRPSPSRLFASKLGSEFHPRTFTQSPRSLTSGIS